MITFIRNQRKKKKGINKIILKKNYLKKNYWKKANVIILNTKVLTKALI